MSDDARARALAYVAGHHVMTLATQGPDGPWAAAVFYAADGFRQLTGTQNMVEGVFAFGQPHRHAIALLFIER